MESDHTLERVPLPYLPTTEVLKDGKERVTLEDFKEKDSDAVNQILISSAKEDIFHPRSHFDPAVFKNDSAVVRKFVVRQEASDEVVAFFYIRHSYPGKSGHICGGGFTVRKDFRGKGILQVMIKVYLRIVKSLGFTISLFHLVYELNRPAVHTYLKMGYTEVGRVPRGGIVPGVGPTDVLILYYDLNTLDQDGNPTSVQDGRE